MRDRAYFGTSTTNSNAKGGNVIEVTMKNFETDVLKSKVPVFVDFYADWCGPCRLLSPVIQDVVKTNGKVNLAKINTDEEGELAQKYEVAALPTVILFKDGVDVCKIVGFQRKEKYLEIAKEHTD
ncbi:Thioredoxin [Zancudomyces culisetae]|uniref:Thioredoxin n=1 Tax=Zancudomyces culisetae TaxID=1213189 RepID=A0A1R1PFA8_ZANCU|nr:Thioredoxin [Zancudomyces culisetae]|eukprot:OMH79609.1 Thioredoxin [Zancudomyces culisetae]